MAMAAGATAQTSPVELGVSAAPSAPAPRAELKPGTTVLCSAGELGGARVSGARDPSLSADGTCVAFTVSLRLPGQGAAEYENVAFVHDLKTGLTDALRIARDGQRMSAYRPLVLSADGSVVAMTAYPAESATQEPREVVLFDRSTRAVMHLDPAKHGALSPVGFELALTADGSSLVFGTTADFGRGIRKGGCFLLDVATQAVQPLPCGAGAMWSIFPSVSADGQVIVFQHLDTAPADPRPSGTYVLDREAGTVFLLEGAGAAGNPWSRPRVSADGRFVAYMARGDRRAGGGAKGVENVFVHDRYWATSECVSVSSSGEPGDGPSISGDGACLSADGRFVAFGSEATNLVPRDSNRHSDIFVRDRRTGRTVRVNVASDGAQGDEDSWSASLSADGRRVAFESAATTLTPDDTNGVADIFVHEIDWGEEPGR